MVIRFSFPNRFYYNEAVKILEERQYVFVDDDDNYLISFSCPERDANIKTKEIKTLLSFHDCIFDDPKITAF